MHAEWPSLLSVDLSYWTPELVMAYFARCLAAGFLSSRTPVLMSNTNSILRRA